MKLCNYCVKIWIALLVASNVACSKKNKLPIPLLPTYNYQRTDVGYTAVYKVDSTVYDNFTQTKTHYTYYIKTINDSIYTTVDTFKIARQLLYKSSVGLDSFNYMAVQGLQYRAGKTIELKNNVKCIILNYPLTLNKTWNINAENNKDSKNSTITSIVKTFNYATNYITNVVEITYENDSNLIAKNVEQYLYAENIGMVKKEITHLQSQNIKPNIPVSMRATNGYTVTYTLVQHN
jgi:hypothetical protein